ncbi:MAG: YeeE/YedE family protein [Nocardiopsaceae bacterium]|jgi:uncharacterized membrane protein YedE/YeeE|nr:YeeE/YedE family protein [Nocardiopsaceae bacterium]
MTTRIRVPTVDSLVTVKPSLRTAKVSCAPPEPDPQAPVKVAALCGAGVLAVVLAVFVWVSFGPGYGATVGCGLLVGLALYHSHFGFSSSWRQFVTVGNGQGLRAQLLLFGTAASVIALVAGTGTGLFGTTPDPAPNPIGIPLMAGAVLFAIGMQLAGSCAAGTLYAVGSGQSSIVFTLVTFIGGSVFATWCYPVISKLPARDEIFLSDHFGWAGSWAITAGVLGVLAAVTWLVQRKRNPPPVKPEATAHGIARLYRGSWPMYVGAIVIGVGAGLILLVTGGLWALTNAFSLWGAKILQVFGMHPEHWEYWRVTSQGPALAKPLLSDKTSLTDFGIMIGAAAAAAAAGAWQFRSRIPWQTVAASLLGGFLMGFGSRISNGCNIGAMLGGISAGGLSGWVWAACGLAGTLLGVKIRPLFGLTVPKPDHGIC